METETNESVENLEVAEQESTVESTVENNEEDTTEAVEETVDNSENTNEEEKEETEQSERKQTKEENAEYASIRRKAEEEAKKKIEQARKEAYEQGLAQGKIKSYIGKQNPYTGQIINDDYDVQEYLDMYELDSSGKDPVNDYREMQKAKLRKEAEEDLKAQEKAKQDKWYQDDTQNFVDKYGADKLTELTKDADFNLFAEGKIGKSPLGDIYESYQKLMNKFNQKSAETAKKIIANNKATPGGAGDGQAQELDWNNMSKEQFEKYVEKAKNGELR